MNFLKFTFVFLLCVNLYSQVSENDIRPSAFNTQLLPNNPEVSELKKFTDISVNEYNGTANISIPIYSISFDGITIPIEAKYNTSGVRVEQEASWIGLGWSLNEGYTITREIQGFDDLNSAEWDNRNVGWIYSNTYLKFDPVYYTIHISPSDFVDLSESYDVNHPHDTEPDLFNINLPNASVNFYLPKIQGTETFLIGEVINDRNYKVIYNIANQNFEITDPSGYVFLFNVPEYSTGFSSWDAEPTNIDEVTALQGIPPWSTRQSRKVLMDWKLSKITSPMGRELNFTYEDGLYYSFPRYSEKAVVPLAYPGSGNTSIGNIFLSNVMASVTVYHTKYLSSIYGDFGSVAFQKSSRIDLSSNETVEDLANRLWDPSIDPNTYNAKKLDGIVVKDFNNNIVKQGQFSYTYFNNDELTNQSIEVKEQYIRLKLDNIQVDDQTYSFNYIEPDNLPKKDSKAIDFWGFYNGVTSNTIRIPSSNRFYRIQPSVGVDFYWRYIKRNGAIRKSDFNYGKIGLLNKITYPTGGQTEFEYTGNKATLERASYTPIYNPNNSIKNTGLSSSESYNFRYQYLKLANDPDYELYDYNTCSTNVSSPTIGIPFSIVDTYFCTGQDYNIKIDATLACATNCDLLYPYGRAVWIEDTIGNLIQNVFYYDGHFNVNIHSVNLEAELNLPLGDYILKQEVFTETIPNIGTVVYTADASAIVWDDTSVNSTSFEEFEVGGARLSKITNKDSEGNFLTSKVYSYSGTMKNNTIATSGKLMDDLVYTSSGYSNYEYTPELFADSCSTCGGHKAYLHSDNMLRTSNAANGSHIGYDNVSVRSVDALGTSIGRVDSKFINVSNKYSTRFIGESAILGGTGPTPNTEAYYQMIYDGTWQNYYTYELVYYGDTYIIGGSVLTHSYENGSLLKQSVFDQSGTKIKETINDYETYHPSHGPFSFYPKPLYFNGITFIFHPYEQFTGQELKNNYFSRIKSSLQTDYFDSASVSITTNYYYENPDHYMTTKVVRETSYDEYNMVQNIYYPQDMDPQEPYVSDLINANRFNTQMEVKSSKETLNSLDLLTTKKTTFDLFGALVLPSTIETLKGEETTNNEFETRLSYHSYDAYGNPREISQGGGAITTYIWGYNGQYPVVKVDNISYSLIPQSLIDAVLSASDSGNEQTLLTAISNLRNHSSMQGTLVTGYTYKPLIGVSTITDPKGLTTIYMYDSYGRLEYVKDYNGKVLSKNEYHYKD